MLSNDRADQVAARMDVLGLRPCNAFGLGGRLLLPADDSPRGRADIRRVQIRVR